MAGIYCIQLISLTQRHNLLLYIYLTAQNLIIDKFHKTLWELYLEQRTWEEITRRS
jgi:hypothetical protein